MACTYTFTDGSNVIRLEGIPALKAYLATGDILTRLLPNLSVPGFRRAPISNAVDKAFSNDRIEMVNRVASGITQRWSNSPKVNVFYGMQDTTVPAEVREADRIQKEGGAVGEPEGFIYKGQVYLNAEEIPTAEDAARVLFHEALGHYGLRGVYGGALGDVLDQIIALRKPDVMRKVKEYGLDAKDQRQLQVAAEELLAELAQSKPDNGFVKRAIAAIRTWLRQNAPGFASLQLSDAEIVRDFLMPARAFVERGTEKADTAIAFSRAVSKEQPEGLTPPEQGMLRRIQANMQDNMNRVRQVQDRIAEITGKPVPQFQDYYGAETRRPGRIAARLEDAREGLVKPIVADLAKAGHTVEQLGELLHAMHAPERNERVKKINPEMDSGSGMTDEQAAKVMAKYKDATALKSIAKRAQDLARSTLELKRQYGLIDKDTFDVLYGTYENYVPLKGDGEYGPRIKRAMGHDEREEFILENISRDYEQAVVVGEKNVARQSLLAMVLQNPDPALWTVGVPPKGRYVAGKVYEVRRIGSKEPEATFISEAQVNAFLEGKGSQASQYEVTDSGGERVQAFVRPLQDNEVMVYVDGRPVRIQIVGDEKLARQLRPLDQGQMNVILEGMRNFNRYLSRIYTGYNPAFILRNAVRDALTGTVNILGNEGATTAAKAWARYPSAVKAMGQWAATGKAPDTEVGKMLTEYRNQGGKTGASYMADLEEQGKSIARMYEDAYGAGGYLTDGRYGKAAKVAGRKVVGGLAHVVEVANQATENGLRFALYMAMRDQGLSAGEAAKAAKSVTVDFDRKGAMTPALGAIYLFFNPAVQGTANAIKTLVKGQKREQAWMALGALAALGLYAATSGMDDDKDRWLGTSWDTRSRNLILKIGDKTRLSVPMSYEFAPFYSFGVAMGEALRGESKLASAGRVMSSFFDAYFPLQGAYIDDSDNHGLDAVGAAMPTVIKPAFQAAVNRNTFGTQIAPDNQFVKDQPDNLKMYRNTKNTAYDSAAQKIASAGEALGAGRYENDITKVSPETLKHFWRTYTGGLGAFVADSAGLARMTAEDSKQLEVSDYPFVKDFVKQDDVKAIRGRFYDVINEAKKASIEFGQAKKAADDSAMDDILSRPEKAELLGYDRMIRSTQSAVAKLRDEAVDVNADTSLTPSEKRAKLKELEAQEEEMYRSVIGAFK